MISTERWNERILQDGEWVRADFGDLSLVVANCYEEWRVARLTQEQSGMPPSGKIGELPDGLVFERWDHDVKDARMLLRPTYPTLPVVARPLSILNMSPKGSALFYVGIPAWIEVVAECQGGMQPLKAFPTVELSKTWHGDHLAGQLGYALKTYARRNFDPAVWPEYDIVCAINLVNEGVEMMPFDRLYLQTGHLSVFEGDGRLWSNAARIRTRGNAADLSDVTYGSKPVKPYDQSVEVTEPRMGKVRRSTMTSTFSRMLGSFNPMDE